MMMVSLNEVDRGLGGVACAGGQCRRQSGWGWSWLSIVKPDRAPGRCHSPLLRV